MIQSPSHQQIDILFQKLDDDDVTWSSSDETGDSDDWDCCYEEDLSDDDSSFTEDDESDDDRSCDEASQTSDEDGCAGLHFVNRLQNIAEMRIQLEQMTVKGKPSTSRVGDRQVSVSSMMSVDAVANLRKKFNPTMNKACIPKSASTGMLPKRIVDINQETSALCESSCVVEEPSAAVNPNAHLMSILESVGMNSVTVRPASRLQGFFHEWTDENMEAYHSDLIRAIRMNDVSNVKELHRAGRKLLCCNKFGESVVHMMCRHGSTEMLEFFLKNDVPVRLKDDSGRNPLHDACWTGEPNFDCIKLLLKACPDLLLISDNRGFTPLTYVPRRCWAEWCTFLDENKELLKPRELL